MLVAFKPIILMAALTFPVAARTLPTGSDHVDPVSKPGFRAVLIYGGGLARPLVLEDREADAFYWALVTSHARGRPQDVSGMSDRPCLRIAFFRSSIRGERLPTDELDPRSADLQEWFHPATGAEPAAIGWSRAVIDPLAVQRLAEFGLPVRVGEGRPTPCERPTM